MIRYRRAIESDYQNINDFHNRLYKKQRTLEQFYWEFNNAPAGRSIYIVAEDGSKIVGTQCAIPIILLTHQGDHILSGKSEDTLVDPAYRGMNIFNEMYRVLFEECTKNNIKVIWGFTSARKPFLKLGFEIPFDHSQVLMVNHMIPSYRYLSGLNEKNKTTEKMKIAGLCFLSRLKKGISVKRSIPGEFTFNREPITDISFLLVSLLEDLTQSFSIEQDKEYQLWRIYNNPNYYKVYSFSLHDREGNLKGSFLANLTTEGIAYTIQCLFDPGIPFRVRKEFLNRCSHTIFQEGGHAIRNWTFAHNHYGRNEINLFKNSGYSFIYRGVGFVWKKLDELPVEPDGFILSRIATQGIL